MAFVIDNSVRGGIAVTWDPITGAVAEAALEIGYSTGLAGVIQIIGGTPGSVALQGSTDGVNWAPLVDIQGNAIALTALGALEDFTTAVRYIRPIGNAGSVAAVVRVILRS